MSKKIYNPLLLDTAKDEPTFVNPEGTRWWLVSVGSSMNEKPDDPKDGAIYRAILPTGKGAYAVVYENEIVLETSNLEQALYKVDQNYLVRTKR